MSDSDGGRPLAGGVPLSEAIGALRDELARAVWAGQQFVYELGGQQRTLRFKPTAIELTVQAAVTSAGKGQAGVKWWLIDAGAEVSRERAATQAVKLTLLPVMFDQSGHEDEFLIEAADDRGDSPVGGGGGDELLLDAGD